MVYAQNYVHQSEIALRKSDATDGYIRDMSFTDYCRTAKENFPFVLNMIDPNRVVGPKFADYVALMNEISWEFEDQADGGRGAAYNLAQQNSDNRKIGTVSLFKCFSENQDEIPGPDKIILDALGGDGTLTRFFRSQGIEAPTLISGDLSGFMVDACLEQNFPCIRQSATQSLFKDSVLDGVLIAYGSHHLDATARREASAEAFRTIKKGGRFVLHDFEIGTPAAAWFDDVVHPFSRTGHAHPHFSREEMQSLLVGAGFSDIRVFSMYDPFVLRADTAEAAHIKALMHLYRMYDLVRISGSQAEMLTKLEGYVRNTLGEIQIEKSEIGYTATVHREALVAVGTKVSR